MTVDLIGAISVGAFLRVIQCDHTLHYTPFFSHSNWKGTDDAFMGLAMF